MLFNLKNPYERQKFREYVNKIYLESEKSLNGLVEVKKKHTQRSLAQNAYLHVVLGYYASEFGYSLEEVKYDIFKKKINRDIFERKRTNKRGQEITYIRSSTELDKLEMTNAIDRFRNWSAAVCGLYIPAANESEALFAAQQQMEQYQEYL